MSITFRSGNIFGKVLLRVLAFLTGKKIVKRCRCLSDKHWLKPGELEEEALKRMDTCSQCLDEAIADYKRRHGRS